MDSETRYWLGVQEREERLRGEPERDYYFTFGGIHYDGEVPLRKRYVVYRGTFSSARAQMIERFDKDWSHQYVSADSACVREFGLELYVPGERI